MFAFFLWSIAFVFTWVGWSLSFSILAFVTAASYRFMSLESTEFIFSTVLPWVFGIAIFVMLISIVIKYSKTLGTRVDRGSCSGSGFGSFGGDSDSGSDGGF